MIDKHNNTDNLLFKEMEMDPQSMEEWFSFTKTSDFTISFYPKAKRY